MKITQARNFIAIPLTLGILAGCSSPTSARSGQPVRFTLASSTSLASSAGPLAMTSIRLVIGGTSLGTTDQFGCVDCQNAGPEASAVPDIVSIPLDGSSVGLRTEQVQPGSYTAMEVEVVTPTSALLAATPGWLAGNTILMAGRYNGQPFEFGIPVTGMFREPLATPLVVGSGGTPASVQVTISLPVASWFVGGSGTLDPNDAAQRAQIEVNARKSFSAFEKSAGESAR